MAMVCGERIVFEEDFAQVFKMFLDVFELVDDILRIAHAENVTVQRLWNDAVAAAVWASTTGKNHNQRVQVCAVEVTLVARIQMLVIGLADPRNLVQV